MGKRSKYGHFWSHFCNTDDGSIFSKSGHSQSASLHANEPVEIGQEMLKEHLNMILMPNVITMVKVMNAVTIMAMKAAAVITESKKRKAAYLLSC